MAKATVCKTVIHRFKSGCRLQFDILPEVLQTLAIQVAAQRPAKLSDRSRTELALLA